MTEARQVVAALRAAGHPGPYTKHPAQGHFITDSVHTDAAFWRWLLAQQLPATSLTNSR